VIKAGFWLARGRRVIKIGVFMVLAPLIGMTMGFVLMVITINIFKERDTGARRQGVSPRPAALAAPTASVTGPTNAQKTMGIIAVLLFTTGHLGKEFYVPFWVVLSAHAQWELGTMAGGWRIVEKRWACASPSCAPSAASCAETAGRSR